MLEEGKDPPQGYTLQKLRQIYNTKKNELRNAATHHKTKDNAENRPGQHPPRQTQQTPETTQITPTKVKKSVFAFQIGESPQYVTEQGILHRDKLNLDHKIYLTRARSKKILQSIKQQKGSGFKKKTQNKHKSKHKPKSKKRGIKLTTWKEVR